MQEIWKDVSGFEGMYQVSNLGRVKSLRNKKPLIMRTHVNNSGYEMVRFSVKGKTYNFTVHRLVAREFCDGHTEGMVVNHKDANRLNNIADNLEWVTQKENVHDMIARGTHSVKEAHAVAHKKRRRPVIQYTKNGKEVARFKSAREASKSVNVHENCISRVCRGERPYSAGYSWKYIDVVDDIV